MKILTLTIILFAVLMGALLALSCNASSSVTTPSIVETTLTRITPLNSNSPIAVTPTTPATVNPVTSIPSPTSDSGDLGYATVKYNRLGYEIWANGFDGTGNTYNQTNAVAVDKEGNTYVTGLETIKYDKDGKQVWAARNQASTNAITVDNLGNIFATGYEETIKYDKNGNKQWELHQDGLVTALAFDTSGNIVETLNGGESAVIKYDTNGKKIWAWTVDNPDSQEYISSMALDQFNNIYITGGGLSATIENYKHYITIKLDSNGFSIWKRYYEGPAIKDGVAYDIADDVAYGIAVDDEGNIYVTGRSIGIGTHYDFATIKYDSSGNQIWLARYNSATNGDDIAGSMALDSKGNIYVTGDSSSDSGRNYATVKYDNNGNQLWVAQYSGQESGDDNYDSKLVLDPSGNVYVTGRSIIPPFYYGYIANDYYATVKYDTNGKQLWVTRFKAPHSGFNDPQEIVLDADGNIFVTGISGIPPKPPHP